MTFYKEKKDKDKTLWLLIWNSSENKHETNHVYIYKYLINSVNYIQVFDPSISLIKNNKCISMC